MSDAIISTSLEQTGELFLGQPVLVRQQEIPSGSIYKSSKSRAKLSLALSLVFGHSSSAIMNDLFMTFTSRLKVDAKFNVFISSQIGSQWRTILGHPQLIERMGICILSLAHGSEHRGSDVNCIL